MIAQVRPLWAQQYADSSTPTHGVVFVLDSTDRARLPIVRDELNRLARATQLAGAAFVVFANKQVRARTVGALRESPCRNS